MTSGGDYSSQVTAREDYSSQVQAGKHIIQSSVISQKYLARSKPKWEMYYGRVQSRQKNKKCGNFQTTPQPPASLEKYIVP